MNIEIKRLTMFDHLQDNLLIVNLQKVMASDEPDDSYYELIRLLLKSGQSLYDYLIHQMILSDNKKLLLYDGGIGLFEKACLHNDLEILHHFFTIDLKEICKAQQDRHEILVKLEDRGLKSFLYLPFMNYFKKASFEKNDEDIQGFIELLQHYGVGPFAVYSGFFVRELAEGMYLDGVESIDTLDWNEIYNYEIQKEALLLNTKALVEGYPFQNVLLVGASGTGKSTSVKSVVNLFREQKLRLIQMQKGQLHLLPQVLEYIKGRSFKFIIFIDDLSFEANEDEYKFLKSFIEGSISGEMNQVAFYVTSNRRHLIKEIRSERENDIHLQDFIQEMTSLSDRFGLTLLYEGLNQKEYYEMVESMAVAEAIHIDTLELQNQARIYALRHGKMSGRVASQFIKQVAINANYSKV